MKRTFILAVPLSSFFTNQACYKKLVASPESPIPTPGCFSTSTFLGNTANDSIGGGMDGADLSLLTQTNPPSSSGVPFSIIRTQAEWNSIFANASSIPTAPVDFITTMLVIVSNIPCCASTNLSITNVCMDGSQTTIAITRTSYSLTCNMSCPGSNLTAIAVPNNNRTVTWEVTDVSIGPLDGPSVMPTP